MKTIAISIDNDTLDALDRITHTAARPDRARSRKVSNRSEVVRRALREFLERQERSAREAKEREAIARHRALLARQAAVLVRAQAEP
jgi:metal-responsive CopG/Arc/MetJ family transcriptional regulator